MMWFPYVSPTAVPESVRDSFTDIEQVIREASYVVLGELKTASFSTDSDGKPTDPFVAQAIEDATIAQLRFWADTQDTTGAGAQSGGGSILSVTLPGGSGSNRVADKQEARTAPAMIEILRNVPGIRWEVFYR